MATEKKSTEKKSRPAAAKAAAPRAEAAPAAAPRVDNRTSLERRKVVVGAVVSDKMSKTIVVKVDRRVREEFYKKYVVRSRRFKAHDEKNEAKIGDRVELVSSKPISRDKRWVLRRIVRKAGQTADANV
jgi:small subunit ribosomal protein S17